MERFLRYVLLSLTLLVGLNPSYADEAKPANTLRLATTTSTDNSGLLKYLLPPFTEKTGFNVHVIAVGTGKALRMGRDGDADVLLVHAPTAEEQFVAEGFGVKRVPVMYNDFIILGPKNDPAKLKEAETLTQAMQNIANSKAIFLSRGDDSGTHKKEKKLWQAAEVENQGKWYREAGQGMGKVIQMAGELDGYTLSDRGTWLAMKDKSPLIVAFEGDESLFNPYGIIAVNPELHKHSNIEGANALIEWITSEQGQSMIGEFRIAEQQLFTPSATTMQATDSEKAATTETDNVIN